MEQLIRNLIGAVIVMIIGLVLILIAGEDKDE